MFRQANRSRGTGRSSLMRSRWAAIGAAIAVTLGSGCLLVVNAGSSVPSSVVTVDPARILDTRENLGVVGPFERGQSRTVQATGTVATATTAPGMWVPKLVVPVGATGVLLNVTVVCVNRPGVVCQGGYLAVRPGDATGQTATSSLNFVAGDVVPNSVQVGLPVAGNIDIVYGPYLAGAQVDVIADIVGYMLPASSGPAGPIGPAGATGAPGTNGTNGIDGADGTNGVDGADGANGPVEGSACIAGGVSGTIVTFFNADDGLMTVRCARNVVTTLAGAAGSSGWADGTGAAARFIEPYGVAVDTAGNVYVADSLFHTIRKITATGVVTTLAGNGTFGSADGTGAAASFKNPHGVAVDTAGNVYVADRSNHTIRKITPAGVVTTLAGTAGSSDWADGTGAAARFNNPSGVAVDTAGNVYVADTETFTIRKITSAGVVTTLAGTVNTPGSADGTGTAASFNIPDGVAVDTVGNVYVADTGNSTIRKITAAGVVTTLAASSFNSPYGVAVDTAGNVYVAETGNHTIRKITSAGVVTTLAGNGVFGSADGTGTAASFNYPFGVAVDTAGNVYVADTGNYTIRKIN